MMWYNGLIMAKRNNEQTQHAPSPKRIYTPSELKKFHDQIQKYHEDKKIQNSESPDFGKIFKILNWEELAVAYGAMVKRPGNGKGFYYLAARHDGPGLSRFHQFLNLMDQYNYWLAGVDYKKEVAVEKQLEMWDREAPAETQVEF